MTNEFQNKGYAFSINRVSRLVSRVYNKYLADVDLTIGQYDILSTIECFGPILLRDLGERLFIERSAVLRTIKLLTSSGLLYTMADPLNARRLQLHLTEDGRRCLALAAEKIGAADAEIETTFGASTVLQVHSTLMRIANSSEDRKFTNVVPFPSILANT
jgi:DNA-binding MarR family transcriptional regulator